MIFIQLQKTVPFIKFPRSSSSFRTATSPKFHRFIPVLAAIFFYGTWEFLIWIIKPEIIPKGALVAYWSSAFIAVGALWIAMTKDHSIGFQSLTHVLKGRAVSPFFVILGFLGVSIVLVWCVTPTSTSSVSGSAGSSLLHDLNRFRNVLSGPGTIFVVMLSLITVYGFFATLAKLEEAEGRAIDYSSLLERASRLVQNEIDLVGKKGHGKIRIMANSPIFGNISDRARALHFFGVLKKALLLQGMDVQILCLNWTKKEDNITEWIYPDDLLDGNAEHIKAPLPEAAKRKNITEISTPLAEFYKEVASNLKKPNVVPIALREALELLYLTHAKNFTEETDYPRMTWATPDTVKKIPLHFIVTSQGGIIFNAMDLPTESSSQSEDQRINVVAFESKDSGIRDRLMQAFKYHTDNRRAISIILSKD